MILTTNHIISDAVENHDKNHVELDCTVCIAVFAVIIPEKLSMLF
jgi:hypothetical protein